MFCNQCGTQLADGALFCPNCGAKQKLPTDVNPEVPGQPAENAATSPVPPVQEAAVPVQNTEVSPIPPVQSAPNIAVPPMQPVQNTAVSSKKVKKDKKGSPFKILIPAGVVFAAIVIVLVIVLTRGGGSHQYISMTEDLVFGTSNYAFDLSGNYEKYDDYGIFTISQNGETTVFASYSNNALYYVSKDLELVLISKDVADYKVSMTGEYIAYTVYKDNWSYADTTLYLYNVKNDKSTKIDEEVYGYDLCISPSGKVVAYLKDYEGYEDNTLYIGGINVDRKKIDKDGCYPVAISDNGKNFYYVSSSNRLYYYNGKDTEKLDTEVDAYSFRVNAAVSEILYTQGGKTYFYTPKMKEPARIASVTAVDLVRSVETGLDTDLYCSERATIEAKDTLKGSVFVSYGELYWINEEGTDCVRISYGASGYQLSKDGKSLLYIDGGDLYRIKKLNEEMKAELLYDKDYLYGMTASDNLSTIYFWTDENELYYYKGKNKAERLSIDFISWLGSNYCAYNEATKEIFYVEDGDLYKAGKTSKSVKLVAEDAAGVFSLLDGVLYGIDNGDEYIVYYYEKNPIELIREEY